VSVSSPIKVAVPIGQTKSQLSPEDLLTAVLFALCIFIIGAVTVEHCITTTATLSEKENRPFNPFPEAGLSPAQLTAFPSGFEQYFNDRVVGRIELVSLSGLLKYKLFDMSWTPNVLAGKHGWMYFMAQNGLETLQGNPLFTDQELAAWTQMLEERRIWLSQRNIKFLFVIVPAKTSIYPEFLSAQFTSPPAQTRVDQLIASLKQHSQVEVLDLRQPLIDSKNLGELYFKTDGHWNRLGSFVGYSSIVNKLSQWFPELRPLQLTDLQAFPGYRHEGDLAKQLGISQFVIDRYTEYVPKPGFAWKLSNNPPPAKLNSPKDSLKPFASEVPNPKLPKAFFVRDSFFSLPQPFLSEHFRRAYFDWNLEYNFKTEIISAEKPDVLVQEMVENHLFKLPLNPPALKLVSAHTP
jgi:alginate O-acetyltransferase complex protein AlgJ